MSLLLALLAVLAPVPQTAQELLPGLDAYVEASMEAWEVPGVAISVVRDGELVFARGYGVRRLGTFGPVDEQTVFAVASNSKAFTATMLGMLVDEGRIGWDDRVVDHLPWFQMWDPWVTREIRIRDLLCHRGGLSTFGGDHLWIGQKLAREEIVRRLRHLEPTAPFRAKFQYQNLMFAAAGMVVEAVTGQSWDEVLRARILEPLGMSASNSSVHVLAGLDDVASPHEPRGGVMTPVAYDDVDSVAAAAALNSNVVDMSRWMLLNLGGGEVDGVRLVSAETMRTLHSVQMAIPVSEERTALYGTHFVGYGLGWGLSDYAGLKLVTHSGGLSGMLSLQTLVPERGIGIMVVTNAAPHDLARALSFRILDGLLECPARDWSAELLVRRDEQRAEDAASETELQASRVPETRPSLDLEAYVGRYSNPFSGPAEVRLENGVLVYDYNPRHRGPLEHWHHDTFRVTWDDPIFDMPDQAFLRFTLDREGEVAKLTVTFYGPLLDFFREQP